MSRSAPPSREPIAIVGIGCRFQDVADVADLWALLRDGRTALREVPADRFDIDRYYDPTPGRSGRIVTREGGYLRDVWDFDNGLFGLSHREAMAMDPQHRLLLEVGYQALLDAGIPTERIAGSRTAVSVGMFTSDFRDRVLRHAGIELDVYVEIGTTRSSAAGRLSHAFDLCGPSATVDAACASSLVAVHQACQSLWLGSADLALAGGCNLVLEPEATICFSQSMMLSPDSRCKFGDATANGFVRSEGAALAVLKPLSAAERDGDRIYATIRASGMANDGRQGSGLYMTPSVEGQRALLDFVYGAHGIDRSQLVYVEAHGTGTAVGDPVETKAIALALTEDRESPLWVGSVKTNLGHTEGAAGIAGLLRAALALYHREIPPSLHFVTPNPNIPWEAGHLAVPTRRVRLPEAGPLLAGVSAFGLSGTNAHAVLATPPEPAPLPPAREIEPLHVLAVRGHTPGALAARAADLRAALEGADPDRLRDICYTATQRTGRLAHRALAVGSDAAQLRERLGAIAQAVPPSEPIEGGTVFVFAGQGGQWPGMGRTLRRRSPAFRSALEQVDAAFQRVEGWSPIAMLDEPGNPWLDRIDRLQPVLVAVQIATADMWRALGVVPDAVVGHSLGEVSAAYVAGALSLDDAVRVICARSAQLARIAGRGAMAVIEAPAAELEARLEGDPRVVVAVVNAEHSTVISGEPEAVDAVVAAFDARGVRARRVRVDVASHSPQVDPLLPDLRRALAGLAPGEGTARIMSTVDGDWIAGGRLNGGYWVRNLRQPVLFLAASQALVEAGMRRFVECGPHPVLAGPLVGTLHVAGLSERACVVSSMNRDDPADEARQEALATLYAAGVELDFSALQAPGRVISLPPFPFQRETFALPDEPDDAVRSRGHRAGHPWLTRPLRLASEHTVQVWQIPLSLRTAPWLADHRVRGSALLPGAAFVELALATGALGLGTGVSLQDVELVDYLAVPADTPMLLQIQQRMERDGTAHISFHSLDDTGALRLHATARVAADAAETSGLPSDSRALLAERLSIEHARARRNPGHVYGLLVVRMSAQAHAEANRLPVHRIGRSLRSSDFVFALAPDRVVVVASVAHPEQLKVVAQRLLGVLGGSGEAAWIAELRFFGSAVIAGTAPVEEVLARIDAGLPEIEVQLDEVAGKSVTGAQLYDSMNARGIQYGPAFRPVQQLWQGGGSSSARLVLPPAVLAEIRRQPTHPAFLDGCFQAAVASFIDTCDERDGFLPVGVQRLHTFYPPTEHLRCHAWNRGRPQGRDDELLVDFVVTDDAGRPVITADGLRVRRFAYRQHEPIEVRIGRWMHRWRWQPHPLPPGGGDDPRPWIVVGEAEALAARLRARQLPGTAAASAVSAALDALPVGPRGVVFVAPDDADDISAPSLRLLQVMHGIAGRKRADPVLLWVVTARAWSVRPSEPNTPERAGIWGLVRVLANEAAECAPHIVDVDTVDAEALPRLIRTSSAPDEAAVRGAEVFAHVLEQGRPPQRAPSVQHLSPDEAILVELHAPDHALSVRRAVRPAPGDDEVLVRVEAVAWSRIALEREVVGIAGRVQELGRAIGDVAVGDRIVALLPETTSATDTRKIPRDLVLHREHLVKVDARVHATRACELAAHWLPAMVALRGLCAGERLLVADADAPIAHAAAWLAGQRGATVVACAGSLASRAALRACGVDFVVDMGPSDVALATDLAGGPFDRVIDLHRSLPQRVLEPILAHRAEVVYGHAGLAEAGNAAEVRDLLGEVTAEPGRQVAMLRTLLLGPRLLPELWGRFDPIEPVDPPATRWVSPMLDLSRVPMACRTIDDGPIQFDPSGAYLITGGTGGLGLRLAAWLGRRGAGHIVLVSRSARVRPEDALAYEAVTATGAEVHVEATDISQRDAVAALLDRVARIAPVRGVFHLAAVLDDATWPQLDAARFAAVVAPKVHGAWHLHEATEDLPLDHFVLFSSAAATLGSPGQGNYAAANAALDALAHHRRQLGLPGVSVAWGVWSETGLAAAQQNRGERLHHKGLAPMAPADALEALGEVLALGDVAEITVADVDWAAWSRSQPGVAKKASLAALAPAAPADAPAQRSLDGVPPERRREVGFEILRSVVAEVTRLPAARIDDRTRPSTLGLDSLMAVELRAGLLARFGVEMQPQRLLGMRDLGTLLTAILEARGHGQDAPVADRTMHGAALDPAIAPRGPRAAAEPSEILLTGASGFVGVHVLRELLDRTKATVVCLIRADSPNDGRERLLAQLDAHGLRQRLDASRIVVVPGDLAAPDLGMPPRELAALAERVGAIYHCAAWVHHLYDYATLAPANVGGTEAMLRLATTGPTKPVHHVSTVAVFPFTTALDRSAPYTERTPLGETCEPFFGGYAQTKWAAERLCAEAAARGVPVTVYRLGLVTGSHDAARCPSTDALWRIVHAIASLNQIPSFRTGLAMTPVDYVSRALVHLSRQPDTAGATFHLTGTDATSVADLADALHRVGFDVAERSKQSWLEALVARADRGWPIAPIVPRLTALDLEALDRATVSLGCDATLERLPPEIRELRHVDATLLTAYLRQLARDGFLSLDREIKATPVLSLSRQHSI